MVEKTELELEKKAKELLKLLNGYTTVDVQFILKSLDGLIRKNSKINLTS